MELLDKFPGIFFSNNSDTHQPEGYFFLDDHADIRSFSKPGPIGTIGHKICQVVHDLANGEKPDNDFKKTNYWSEIPDSLGNKITRIVPRLTSQIQVKNIRMGIIPWVKISGDITDSTINFNFFIAKVYSLWIFKK
jgi:hypothetical protein